MLSRQHYEELKKYSRETNLACRSIITSEEEKHVACPSILFEFGKASRWKIIVFL